MMSRVKALPGTIGVRLFWALEARDAYLRRLAQRARETGQRLTVLSLVRQEDERRRCCEIQSAM